MCKISANASVQAAFVQVASLVVTGLEWEEIEASESPVLLSGLPTAPNGRVNTILATSRQLARLTA